MQPGRVSGGKVPIASSRTLSFFFPNSHLQDCRRGRVPAAVNVLARRERLLDQRFFQVDQLLDLAA
jgi:hypothetical protein